MSDEQASLTHRPLPIRDLLDRSQLRRAMRQQRNAVPQSLRPTVAQAIARHLSRLLVKGQRIAVYTAFDGEIDLAPVIDRARRIGCRLYAPRIVNMRMRRMEFIALAGRGNAKCNRFSILEPHNNLHRRIDARLLDIVFVPLVAFDVRGWRLGFGAGFYDRKFEFLRRQFKHKPLLIGVGYEFQRVPPQTPSTWDVLLDAVATEHGLQRCRPAPSLYKRITT